MGIDNNNSLEKREHGPMNKIRRPKNDGPTLQIAPCNANACRCEQVAGNDSGDDNDDDDDEMP